MRQKSFKKIILFLLVAGLIINPISLIIPPKIARAQLPVTDVAAVAVLTDIAVNTTVSAGADTKTATFDIILLAKRIAGQILKKLILDRLVDALIAYINRGYKGGIIQDWDQFLEQAGKDAVGLLAQEAGLGFLCGPFNLNVQLALIPLPIFSQQVTCSLDQIVGNIQSFLDDFRNGNWIAYQELWYPNNNYYGATLIAWNEAKIRQGRAAEAAKSEGIASRGFLSQRKCDPDGKNCRVTTPGTIVADAARSALIEIPANSIINAADIAAYIAAIADAAINQLVKSGIEGLQSLGRTADATRATPTNPCAGLTGDAFRACIGLQNLTTASSQSDRNFLLSQIQDTLTPRQQAANLLTSAIDAQTELVDVLAVCPIDVKDQLALEQGVLEELQAKFDDNQTFLDQLQPAQQTISETEDLALAGIFFGNIEPLLDSAAANAFLESVKTQQQEVQANVEAKLPSVKSQCGITT